MEMTRHGSPATPEAVAGEDWAVRTLLQLRKYHFVAVARIEAARARRFVSIRAKES